LKTKTAYRERIPVAETSTPDIEIKDEPIRPSERVDINFDTTNKAEPSVAVVSADEYPQPDEATLALQKQLADLKKSEQMQREYAQHMAQQTQRPLSREEKLAAWRANGGDEGDISFLESHPEMVDRHDVTVIAAEEAAQHHQRGTEAHRAATLEAFRRLQGQQAQAPPAATDPAGFFRPEPSRSPAVPDRGRVSTARPFPGARPAALGSPNTRAK
jgi:hypothetical protein